MPRTGGATTAASELDFFLGALQALIARPLAARRLRACPWPANRRFSLPNLSSELVLSQLDIPACPWKLRFQAICYTQPNVADVTRVTGISSAPR